MNPLSDISQLENRQNLIKSIYEDETTYTKLCEYLDEVCKLEKKVYYGFGKIKVLKLIIYRFLYFKSSILSRFNTSETFLQFYYLKLIISPLYEFYHQFL